MIKIDNLAPSHFYKYCTYLYLHFLLIISFGNPYLKILDLSNLFDANAPMKNNSEHFTYRPENHLCMRGLRKPYSYTGIKPSISTMVLIVDGNSDNGALAWRKIASFGKN